MYLLFIVVFLPLTGCFGHRTSEEKIYEVLEKVVALEEPFEEQQEQLVKLEKDEKALFEKIIALGMDEYGQIVKMSDEALTIIKKRKEHLLKEEKSMKASSKEFAKLTSIIDDINDQELKKHAEQLYNIMMDRYKTYHILNKHYSKGLEYDKELYEMFKQEDITLEQLETQIHIINESYKKVIEANKAFNKLTEDYNNAKRNFYEKAKFKIKSH